VTSRGKETHPAVRFFQKERCRSARQGGGSQNHYG